MTTRDSERGPWSISAAIQTPPVAPVLADGLFAHTERPTALWEAAVQIPNIDCPNCVIKVIQFMAEHAKNTDGDYSYHHCAVRRHHRGSVEAARQPLGSWEAAKSVLGLGTRRQRSGVEVPGPGVEFPELSMTRALVLLLPLLLAVWTPAGAQTNTGEIAGIVRDTQGGALPGATVAAEHLATGTRRRAHERRERPLLPAVASRGRLTSSPLNSLDFDGSSRSGVVVSLGQTLAVDFTLDVGGLTEEIRVTADVPLLQTSNAEISDVIENREVMQLPLNGRNFLALAQLSDAVVMPPGGTRGEALQQAGPLPNVGGQRSGHNIYLLDGVKVTDELFNNLVISPSVDSIQEFKIQKSQYPAEFGGKASALINVATRAGTNAFHGSALRVPPPRDVRCARTTSIRKDQPIPPLRQNQFGADRSAGPLVRDRTFFFASYEGQRCSDR